MNDDSVDYDDPEVEEAWCDERRAEVAAFLEAQQLARGDIGDWPAWHVAPIVSIWAIESATTAGAIGWWAISGDLPTDYISGNNATDPREAVREFAARWSDAAEHMSIGQSPPGMRIGQSPEERKALEPLLRSRARLLSEWAKRDDIWEDLFDDDD